MDSENLEKKLKQFVEGKKIKSFKFDLNSNDIIIITKKGNTITGKPDAIYNALMNEIENDKL